MSASLYHHQSRGVLRIDGTERADFLQGLITQDVQKATPETAIYSAFLTPQGRFLSDFFIFSDGDAFFLTPEKIYLPVFQQKLALYKLRRAVTLTDVSADWQLFSAWQSPAPTGVRVSADPRHKALGDIWLVPSDSGLNATATQADYDSVRIPLALPDGTRDMPFEKAIPLEHNLDAAHAIDWQKGCYMGQELTARTRYRGLVRKRLFAVKRLSGTMPPSGTAVFYQTEEIGDLRSHTDTLALAYLRIEQTEQALATNALLQADQATFAVLPFAAA